MEDRDEEIGKMHWVIPDQEKRSLEDEIAKLQKQKDELSQQQRTDSKSKIAEQRRIRIQDLENHERFLYNSSSLVGAGDIIGNSGSKKKSRITISSVF